MQKDSIDIPVILETASFIVINKPAGIVVNKSDTQGDNFTVQDWAQGRIEAEGLDDTAEFIKRGGIVHRLDKETSGVMIIAKTADAFYAIQKQFKDKTTEKKYTALCHGSIKPEEGEINVPIGRLPWNRMRFGVLADGREAKTFYKVIKNLLYREGKIKELMSLVEVYPKTGRTHQIRVHMQYLRHPIFADALYAGRKTIRKDRKVLNRHFLHASEISFDDPSTGERVKCMAELSSELDIFLRTLEQI